MYTNKMITMLAAALAATVGAAQATDWQAETLRDLAQLHQLILDNHPGVIDAQNPGFKGWLEQGYQQAQTLAPRVKTKDDEAAVLRYYTTGFQDGHLGVVASQRPPLRWAGWVVQLRGGRYVVTRRETAWPSATPELGDEVLGCDGQTPGDWLAAYVAPYVDTRQALESTRMKLAPMLTVTDAMPTLGNGEAQACDVRHADGAVKRYTLQWQQAADEGDVAHSFRPRAGGPDSSLQSLGQGRYWLHLPNFTPDQAAYAQLQGLAKQISALKDVQLLVFDLRGNNGGNSDIGTMMLYALGKPSFASETAMAHPYAQWRVTPHLVKAFDESLANMLKRAGKEDDSYRYLADLRSKVVDALHQHQDWARQENGPTPAGLHLPGARLGDYHGKIAVVTDEWCASACLDFVDGAMQLPDVPLLGHSTSGDTAYIDISSWPIGEQGFTLFFPQKVWRERPRGNNQPYVADYRYDGDLSDTAALQAWALALPALQVDGGVKAASR